MATPKSKPQLSLQAPHGYDDAPGIPPHHWSRLFFQRIFCAFDDAQFADLYVAGGRNPVSPSRLAAIALLQYMFHASDRVAVENTLMRRDRRLALGLAPDYDGLDPTVLVNFRKRLVAHGMERPIFATVLQRIAELGLLTNRRRMRVDSTQLVANVARLSLAERTREVLPEVDTSIEDGGYASVENSIALREMGIGLVAPAVSNTNKGFIPNTEFAVAWDHHKATCPAGHESVAWGAYRGKVSIRFAATTCEAYPRRAECTGSRFRTAAKRDLHAILALAALNVRRLMRHLTSPPDGARVQVRGTS